MPGRVEAPSLDRSRDRGAVEKVVDDLICAVRIAADALPADVCTAATGDHWKATASMLSWAAALLFHPFWWHRDSSFWLR